MISILAPLCLVNAELWEHVYAWMWRRNVGQDSVEQHAARLSGETLARRQNSPA